MVIKILRLKDKMIQNHVLYSSKNRTTILYKALNTLQCI